MMGRLEATMYFLSFFLLKDTSRTHMTMCMHVCVKNSASCNAKILNTGP